MLGAAVRAAALASASKLAFAARILASRFVLPAIQAGQLVAALGAVLRVLLGMMNRDK
ncbi:MAG: hypothetical protein SH859_02675 [Hyphomicrobium aestuarii]|nr:hypothetical protein [Hyphomicrobium aestuarii]